MKKQQQKLNKRRKQKIYHTVGTVQKYIRKNQRNRVKCLTYVYITIQYPGLMLALN